MVTDHTNKKNPTFESKAQIGGVAGNLLTPHPVGVSTDPARRWGGGSPTPPMCRTTEPIVDPKLAFDNAGHERFEYIYTKITILSNATGQVKGQILDNLPSLASPGKVVTLS